MNFFIIGMAVILLTIFTLYSILAAMQPMEEIDSGFDLVAFLYGWSLFLVGLCYFATYIGKLILS